MTYFVLCRM